MYQIIFKSGRTMNITDVEYDLWIKGIDGKNVKLQSFSDANHAIYKTFNVEEVEQVIPTAE